MRLVALLVALVLTMAPIAAGADDGDALGPEPRRLDVFLGPVQGSSRAVGLSGAFVSIAEGVEGLLWNPAAVANRYPYSLDWWDWDLDAGLLLPTNVGGQDFDNDGRTVTDYRGSNVALFGGSLAFGFLGFGGEGSVQSYSVDLERDGVRRPVDVRLTTLHGDAAFGLLHGQLIVGLGIRGILFGIDEPDSGGLGDDVNSLDDNRVGFEAGALLRLDEQPFRIAAVVRTPMVAPVPRTLVEDDPATTEVDETTYVEDCTTLGLDHGSYVPCEIALPWEVELGASWMLGPRVYNPRWHNPMADRKHLREELQNRRMSRWQAQQLTLAQIPQNLYAQESARMEAEEQRLRAREERELDRAVHRVQREREEAYHHAPRRYLLISADLVITGAAQDAIGIEAFARQEEQASGEDISLTPRLGLESEVWYDRLRLRAGSYLEPSRFRDVGPRPHGTFGLDVRLFYTTLFDLLSRFGVRASGVIDLAPNYLQFAVSLGIWH